MLNNENIFIKLSESVIHIFNNDNLLYIVMKLLFRLFYL